MTPLRAIGSAPKDLRKMLTDWWLIPLAGALLEAAPDVKHLTFVVRALPGDRVAPRLVPGDPLREPSPAWAKLVERTHQRLFCAPATALDADEGAARAYGAFCSADPKEWTDVWQLIRVPLDWAKPDQRSFRVELVDLLHRRRPDSEAPAERARAARIAAPVVDPDVAALLSGLEALDRRDELYRLCAELHWLRVRREPAYQIHDAARALEAALKSLSASPPEHPKRPGTP